MPMIRAAQSLVAMGLVGTFAMAMPALADGFRFENEVSLDDMREYIVAHVPLGTAREDVRRVFVEEGGAKLQPHPDNLTIEKYTYNINLCRTYVWRWNISADYDADGMLMQLFVNGEPAHAKGHPKRTHEDAQKPGGPAKIEKGWKPRPEADRGENALAFVRLNLETTSNDIGDKFIVGGGPTRADPTNMGTLHMYSGEHWRSIFDDEQAETVHDYAGNCPPNTRTGSLYPEPFRPSLAQ